MNLWMFRFYERVRGLRREVALALLLGLGLTGAVRHTHARMPALAEAESAVAAALEAAGEAEAASATLGAPEAAERLVPFDEKLSAGE